MATTISKLAYVLSMNTQPMQAGITQANSLLGGLQSTAMGIAAKLSAAFGGITAAGFVGWGVKLAADLETASASFEVLTGSAKDAEKLLGDLRDLSASTPLTFGGLQDNAKVLLSFGVATEQVATSLEMLGNIAGGNQEKMQSLTLAFAQMSAAGRLMGQDLLQMVNAGFNPLQEISRRTGRSMVQLKADMEAGLITTQMVVDAFRSATGEGGRFDGMLEKMGNTLSGRWAKLKDSVAILATQVGERLMPALKKLVDVGITVVDWLRSMDDATAQTILKTAGFVAGFVAAMAIIPRVIAMFKLIVSAYKALATAQTLQLALSGPKGWAILAGSLVVAAGAAYAVNEAFSGTEQELQQVATKSEQVAQANATATESFASLGEEASNTNKVFEELGKRGASITESVRTPVEIAADAMNELNQLVQLGIISQETYQRAVAKTGEELANATNQADKLREAGRINVGALSRNSVAGFSAALQNANEQKRQIELAQRQLEQQKKIAAATEEANRLARERQTIKQVSL